MRGIINNIINFYQIQAEALNVLVINTQKALEQSDRERKANEQAQRVENFVRNLIMDLNSMFMKFYFFKDRKNKRYEPMTDRQANVIAEFAIFAKTLTKRVRPLLNRFQQDRNFEEKIDKEIKELETSVRRKLRKFDKALDETKAALPTRLIQFARNITGGFGNLFQARSFVAVANKRKSDKISKKPAQNQDIEESFSAQRPNTNDDRLENLFNSLNIKSVTHLKA
jgi:hypothetical protein